MKKLFYDYGKHILALIIFTTLSAIYFAPSVFEGKHLSQGDDIKATGMGASQMEQFSKTAKPGEFSAWSDAMFSGMPYVSGYGDPAPKLPSFTVLDKPVKGIGYKDAGILLMGLICFYVLMCVMRVNWWLSIMGAIAFAMASYNIIIIEAGHITKAYVIAMMPLTLAGLKLLFDRKYLWGGVLLLLGIAFSLANSHIQITYYLMLLCLFIFAGFCFICIKDKAGRHFTVVTAISIVCVLLAILPNARNLYSQWDLGKNSTRGATELNIGAKEGEKVSSGLDKDYAFQWSYGKKELLTFLIPNAYGGSSSSSVKQDSHVNKALSANGMSIRKDMKFPVYWGDKPFTSGPVYIGAIICLLFIFGMVVIANPMKWWLLAGAFFLTLLAWGRNFDAFNTLMFHYLPMYNKFRTVEMALVIPGLVLPVIGIWGLNEYLAGRVDSGKFKSALKISLGITGGITLLIWLLPGLFLECTSAYDASMGLPDWFMQALVEDRKDTASSDALRSLIFILLTAGLMVWFKRSKRDSKAVTAVSVIVTVLVMTDLWSVDRRFLNKSNFVRTSSAENYSESAADKAILEDKDLSFRVFTLDNPFQETSVSYYHHSIGGYHAAKLRRYQELIDYRLNGEYMAIMNAFKKAETTADIWKTLSSCPSLNMLNTKYIIYNPEYPPLENPFALGNAWFVKRYQIVENADAEITALNSINPAEEAVIDRRFADALDDFSFTEDSTATIRLTSYRPNHLTYSTSTQSDQLAVFSEIYYNPGWNVTIDGALAGHFRADWTLRAMIVPAGKHEITFDFRPGKYVTASFISRFSSFAYLLLFIFACGWSIWKRCRRK